MVQYGFCLVLLETKTLKIYILIKNLYFARSCTHTARTGGARPSVEGKGGKSIEEVRCSSCQNFGSSGHQSVEKVSDPAGLSQKFCVPLPVNANLLMARFCYDIVHPIKVVKQRKKAHP
jgi:hypothetical protein